MKTVLNEEEYMERLGAILKRDFFPSLESEFSEPEQLSISEFQSLFTTEDNASFEELLARENARKREKFEKVYGGPALLVDNPSKRLLLQESRVDERKFKAKNDGKCKKLKWTGRDEKIPFINTSNTRFNNEEDQNMKKFRIPQSPAREQLAHALATPKVSKQKSNSSTPRVPKYSMDDLKALTPRRKPI